MDAKRLAEALKSLDNQNFGPNDSVLASTINHPVNAGGKFLDWLKNQVNTAAGIPDQYDNPNPLLAPKGQEQAAFDLAGMAQLGSMPFAPKSSGGTLGTAIKRGDYVGEHKAPLKDSGAPLHDLTANENAIYPDDVYGPRANDYYGTGEPEDRQIFSMARYLKGKPLEKVSMYRAVPDPNYELTKQIKDLEKISAYKNKFGFFPNENPLVDELFNKHNLEGVSYDETQKNMLDEIYARINELESSKQKLPKINHGDWVALDKKYAKEHGESALNGQYKILSKKVPAKQLFTNGDSIREWGWDSTATRLLPATMLGYGMANQKPDNQSIAEALRGQ